MPDFGFADYTADVPNVFGKMRYLQAVFACVPEAIEELVALSPDDEAGFRSWAERRGFTDEWAFTVADKHRRWWSELPEAAGKWLIASGAFWEPVMPAFERWNPFVESEAALRQRFEQYIETCKASPGMIPTPDKRTGDAHFEWLALHHAGRLTYGQIEENDWSA